MADDNQSRYRSSDPFGSEPAAAAPASDPLAELARLIGRSDPYSNHGRATRPAQHEAPAHYEQPAYGNDPAPYGQDGHQDQHYASDPAPPSSRTAAAPAATAPLVDLFMCFSLCW